jgi:hypothetical protein
MGGLWSIIFLETFRILCGELVEQVRILKTGIGAFEKLTNSVPDPLIPS